MSQVYDPRAMRRQIINELDLAQFAGGAVQEKVNAAMDAVGRNIKDPNIPWKGKREITIKIIFEPDESRDMPIVTSSVKTKLVEEKEVGTRMVLQNTEDGTPRFKELNVSQPNTGFMIEQANTASGFNSINK